MVGERDELLAARIEEGIGAHQQRLRPQPCNSFECAMDFVLVARLNDVAALTTMMSLR